MMVCMSSMSCLPASSFCVQSSQFYAFDCNLACRCCPRDNSLCQGLPRELITEYSCPGEELPACGDLTRHPMDVRTQDHFGKHAGWSKAVVEPQKGEIIKTPNETFFGRLVSPLAVRRFSITASQPRLAHRISGT